MRHSRAEDAARSCRTTTEPKTPSEGTGYRSFPRGDSAIQVLRRDEQQPRKQAGYYCILMSKGVGVDCSTTYTRTRRRQVKPSAAMIEADG